MKGLRILLIFGLALSKASSKSEQPASSKAGHAEDQPTAVRANADSSQSMENVVSSAWNRMQRSRSIKDSEQWLSQVLALIFESPSSKLLTQKEGVLFGYPWIPERLLQSALDRGTAMWLDHLRRSGDDELLRSNAAFYFRLMDRGRSLSIAEAMLSQDNISSMAQEVLGRAMGAVALGVSAELQADLIYEHSNTLFDSAEADRARLLAAKAHHRDFLRSFADYVSSARSSAAFDFERKRMKLVEEAYESLIALDESGSFVYLGRISAYYVALLTRGVLVEVSAPRAVRAMERQLSVATGTLGRARTLVEIAALGYRAGDMLKCQERNAQARLQIEELSHEAHRSDLLHDLLTLEGLCDATREKTELACDKLQQSARYAPKSGTANMDLASELLDRGPNGDLKQCVMQYLMLCSERVPTASSPLGKWLDDIANGKRPEFGTSLRFLRVPRLQRGSSK